MDQKKTRTDTRDQESWDEIHLVIAGAPKPQPRPRLSKYGVFDPAYQFKKTYEHQVRKQLPSGLLKDSGLVLGIDATFYMMIPQYAIKQKLAEKSENAYHTNVPDIDNLIKLMLDCLNEIAFSDDRQIAKICCEKKYSNNPRTEIKITNIRR